MATVGGRGPITTGRAGSDIASGTSDFQVSQREDLSNFISMITRDETPFMASIGKTKAKGIYHEWQTDTLEAPGDSKLKDGADWAVPGSAPTDGGAAFDTVGPHRTRLGNYCQINGKVMAVSGTRRAIDQAGVADEYAYQLKKRGTELKRDVEFDLVHSYNTASGTDIRKMGGYQSFINHEDTVNFAGTGWTDGSADGSDMFTASSGTNGSLALSDVDAVMQKIYEEGGKASRIMLSPKLRRDFSDLMVTDTGVRRNIDMDGKLRQSVDVYMSDFGDLMVIPNYIMGLANTVDFGDGAESVADFAALIYDPQWFKMATLRPLAEVDVGAKGDSTVGMMVEEQTLQCLNPRGCGAIYGLS